MMYDHDHDNLHDEDLRQAARRIGHAAAERLDVEKTAQAVLTRLRAGGTPARSPIHWLQPAWMRAAAVVVLMVGTGILIGRGFHEPAPSAGIDSTVALAAGGEFADFTSGQLQDVLTGLEEPTEMTPAVHAAEAGVEDLSEPQLQSLLKAMED